MNINTNGSNVGAVLIRAVQPVDGISKMKKRRGTDLIHNLCSGPGKLCQAFGISKKLNGKGLNAIKIFDNKVSGIKIVKTSRIGIKEEKPRLWRFYIKGNEWVSRK